MKLEALLQETEREMQTQADKLGIQLLKLDSQINQAEES